MKVQGGRNDNQLEPVTNQILKSVDSDASSLACPIQNDLNLPPTELRLDCTYWLSPLFEILISGVQLSNMLNMVTGVGVGEGLTMKLVELEKTVFSEGSLWIIALICREYVFKKEKAMGLEQKTRLWMSVLPWALGVVSIAFLRSLWVQWENYCDAREHKAWHRNSPSRLEPVCFASHSQSRSRKVPVHSFIKFVFTWWLSKMTFNYSRDIGTFGF